MLSSRQDVSAHVPHVTICLIDSRIFRTIKDIVCIVTNMRTKAPHENIQYWIQHPHIANQTLVREVLIRMLNTHGGTGSFLQTCDEGGFSILCFAAKKQDVQIKHVSCMEAPAFLDMGNMRFGKVLIYAEMQFTKTKKEKVSSYLYGILWAPQLACVGKPWASDQNLKGASDLLIAHAALMRFQTESVVPSVAEAISAFKQHVDGFMLLTDLETTHVGTLHNWHACGKLHILQGNVDENGSFQSTDDKLRICPGLVGWECFHRIVAWRCQRYQHNQHQKLVTSLVRRSQRLLWPCLQWRPLPASRLPWPCLQWRPRMQYQ